MSLYSVLSSRVSLAPLRLQGLTGRMYLATVISAIGIGLMALYVAGFAISTRASISEIERSDIKQSAQLTELKELQLGQRGIALTFFLATSDTFRQQDIDRLRSIGQRLVELDKEMGIGLALSTSNDLNVLNELAAELAEPTTDTQSQLATLREFLQLSGNVDRQLNTYLNQRTQTAHQRLLELSAFGDALAWCVAIVSALLIVVVLPMMVLSVTRLVHRINRVTRTMHRIADCETAVDVPSTVDIDEVGELARAVQAFKRNTIALQRNSDEMLRLNGWFDLALNNMQSGLSIFDQKQELVMCNERFREIYDLPKSLTRPGTPLSSILELWKTAGDGQRASDEIESEIEIYKAVVADGQESVRIHTLTNGRSILVSCRPASDGGWVDMHEDVTERVQTDRTIERLAHTDQLTGLMNRQHFMKALGQQLDEQAVGPEEFAVMLVDLTNFKGINETYGHQVGDQVLKAVADRLSGLTAGVDSLARLGGDGFGLVRSGVGKDDVQLCADEIFALLQAPVLVDGQSIEIGISVGAATAPLDGKTTAELLQRAEIALYRAKTSGQGIFVSFDPSLENALKERQGLEKDLKVAFELGQFELHYQPIIDYKSRQVASMEALMRWRHPARGMVPPNVFIPIAEETGLIVKLGAWAIEQACRDAMTWPSHVRVAVNLSAAQFYAGGLADSVTTALQETGLPANRLEVEVTESLLLSDEAANRQVLNSLQTLGVAIALDDFGTGYASLSYLRSFPFNKIKIDQTFVRDLPRSADCTAIVRSVVFLAQMLGMRTVAEGVETAQHLAHVAATGCDHVQGYFLSRPVPAAAVTATIEECEARIYDAA